MALKARGVRCFYDADEQIELWGKYLAEELPVIYAEQAAAVVVFVSAEYAARDWTRLERRAALNRAVRERREYVLPARFDKTPLPGLLSDMVAVDLRGYTASEFADLVVAKLADLGISQSPSHGGVGGGFSGGLLAAEVDPQPLGIHAEQWRNDLEELHEVKHLIDQSLSIEFQRRILSRRFGDYGDGGGSDE